MNRFDRYYESLLSSLQEGFLTDAGQARTTSQTNAATLSNPTKPNVNVQNKNVPSKDDSKPDNDAEKDKGKIQPGLASQLQKKIEEIEKRLAAAETPEDKQDAANELKKLKDQLPATIAASTK